MNNFDKGLAIVQMRCLGNSIISGDDGLRHLAAEMDVPVDRLHFYLECMNDIGLIRYSQKDKTIALTDKGAKTKRVFS